MRWIFLTLLLVNLAYLSWHNFAPRDIDDGEGAPLGGGMRAGSTEIVLLEEQDQTSRRQFTEVVTNPILEGERTERGGEACGSIGPFPDLFAGWQMVDHLAALGFDAEVKAVDKETGRHDYRVLMPPLPSLQEAFRKLRELKARNIDSYVITEGPNALGISLGVFSAEQGARRTRERLERDGYEVVVVEIPRFHREYWAFRTDGREFALDEAVWQQLVRAGEPDERSGLRCQ